MASAIPAGSGTAAPTGAKKYTWAMVNRLMLICKSRNYAHVANLVFAIGEPMADIAVAMDFPSLLYTSTPKENHIYIYFAYRRTKIQLLFCESSKYTKSNKLRTQ